MLVSTVGPFTKWGEPAVRAAITGPRRPTSTRPASRPSSAACSRTTGRSRKQAGVPLLTAMGYDFVPGALAGALALEEAGEDAVRVDVGYYALGMTTQSGSTGTRASLVGASLDESHAFRDGALRSVRTAERVRSFPVKDKERAAVSVGGAEHLGAPRRAIRSCRRSTSTSAGSARSRGRCRRARSSAPSPRGSRACARR